MEPNTNPARRKRCTDCPLVGAYCEDHHRLLAEQAIVIDKMKTKVNVFFGLMGVLVVFLVLILEGIRQDAAAIRVDMSAHLSHHITGSFLPSREAEPRKKSSP